MLRKTVPFLLFCSFALILAGGGCKPISQPTADTGMFISRTVITNMAGELQKTFGDAQAARIKQGVTQAATFWRKEDGDEKAFTDFCKAGFIADPIQLKAVFEKFEKNFMLIDGYYTELNRDLTIPLQLDTGPVLPIDELFGQFSPGVHLNDDMFKTKIAFVALLNFPITKLEDRLKNGPSWTRMQWAETRLAGRFSSRIPSEVLQEVTNAYTKGDTYISSYNVYMNNVLDEKGARLFPEGLKLISHWGLRDELKSWYDKADGLPQQKMIQSIMEKIISQKIPAAAINNPDVDWTPSKDAVAARATAKEKNVASTPEDNVRYTMWQNIFKAEKGLDPYFPDDPSFIKRKFNREREIPEQEVEALLKSVLSSPLAKEIGTLISKRLNRPLQPFDIWYNGFKPKMTFTQDELDKIVSKKYPNVAAFQKDVPSILQKLGFTPAKASFLAGKISVDPARGSGHAASAGRLSDNAHLRTRIPATGMNYKGYNIAIHELGHNVEQTFSFQSIDHTLLRSVPNTAFTEGFAFVFQARDLDILGLSKKDPAGEALTNLNTFWMTYEIAGVALTDMRVWRWMYENPNATPAQMKDAVMTIAKEVWNEFYAPVFGVKDVTLLAIYSHMIDAGMYTPDYPMGHIIAFQIEEYMKTRNLAVEMERMCLIGSISPDLWMKTAVGAPISTEPMLNAAKEALAKITAQ